MAQRLDWWRWRMVMDGDGGKIMMVLELLLVVVLLVMIAVVVVVMSMMVTAGGDGGGGWWRIVLAIVVRDGTIREIMRIEMMKMMMLTCDDWKYVDDGNVVTLYGWECNVTKINQPTNQPISQSQHCVSPRQIAFVLKFSLFMKVDENVYV